MKNLVFLLIFLLFYYAEVKGQFVNSRIVISGLTCSMCSKGVENALKELDFVKSVSMELNTNVAYIDFKPGKEVYMKDLAEKVLDGGFSIHELYATFSFDDFIVKEGNVMKHHGEDYIFIGIKKDKTIDNLMEIKFLGKKYQNQKDFRSWKGRLGSYSKYENSSYLVTI